MSNDPSNFPNLFQANSSMGNRTPAMRVEVVDINMPFGSMVVFMIKWAVASIPAFIILWLLGVGVATVLAVVFSAIGAAGRF